MGLYFLIEKGPPGLFASKKDDLLFWKNQTIEEKPPFC